MLKISKGKISSPVRAVIYGPEGVGKTTLATWAPKPLFLDLEGGTKNLEVDRIDQSEIQHWGNVQKLITDLGKDNLGYRTLVIDSIDWLETLATEYICAENQKKGLEDFGWGKGFQYLAEAIDRLLKQIDQLIEQGMHVILLGHSHTRKHEDPGQVGSYDRFELKLSKNVGPLIREWADLLGFMTYKQTLTEGDKGKVAVGGKERVINLEHNAAWDAKNRYNLPAEVPAIWESLAPAFNFEYVAPKPQIQLQPDPQKEEVQETEPEEPAKDPLTEADEPEPATQVQLNNLNTLWAKCIDELDYKASHMKQLWTFYKLEGKPGMWSKLEKSQAAEVIAFLTSKLEKGPEEKTAA